MIGPNARWWTREGDRIVCSLCPRACRVKAGQRAFCFSRMGGEDGMVLTDYGRSSGFCLDPIEAMPLHHYYPGSRVLAFGTMGCNLACRYCQNWDIARAGDDGRLLDAASPEAIAAAARRLDCRAVALSFNDPVLWAELALDVSEAAHAQGLDVVAKTAGYISDGAREELFGVFDAVSVDLKGFNEDFYRRVCGGQLGPVLDTLRFVARHTAAWLEIVTLLIPGENDSDAELAALCAWVAENLGPQVPIHFNAYHPEHRMALPATPPATLARARAHAAEAGLRTSFSANAGADDALDTLCHRCGALLIARSAFRVSAWHLRDGACPGCGAAVDGRFEAQPGRSVARRFGVRLGARASDAPVNPTPS